MSEVSNNLPSSVLTKSQKKVYGPKFFTEDDRRYEIIATVRYDDECGNGHNSFSITGEIWRVPRRQDCESTGCIHEKIAEHFPELAPFIKWHLVGSDGPMYYLSNTIYHASNRDHRGLQKGEMRQLRNGRTNKPVWQRVVRGNSGEVVGVGSASWTDSDEEPDESICAKWEAVLIEGEGKARELNHARSSAVWPEATDEQLTADPAVLRAALTARLPALMEEFKAAVESLGLVY